MAQIWIQVIPKQQAQELLVASEGLSVTPHLSLAAFRKPAYAASSRMACLCKWRGSSPMHWFIYLRCRNAGPATLLFAFHIAVSMLFSMRVTELVACCCCGLHVQSSSCTLYHPCHGIRRYELHAHLHRNAALSTCLRCKAYQQSTDCIGQQ